MNPTKKELDESFKFLKKETVRLSNENKPHVVFIYFGGHGASVKEQQLYLLNNEEPKHATFNLEIKARSLTGDYSLCKVFAIYDCCRVPLDTIKELNQLYVGKGIETAE